MLFLREYSVKAGVDGLINKRGRLYLSLRKATGEDGILNKFSE